MSAPPSPQSEVPLIDALPRQSHSFNTALQQTLFVSACLAGVILVAAAWAIFFRKKRRRHQSRHHWLAAEHAKSAEGAQNTRHRRRRRALRHLNPTLAEKEGLPPVRNDPANPSLN